jgi:hypothetical protein
MCVFRKTQHSFTLYLSILYLSLVPHRSTCWSSNQNITWGSSNHVENENTGNHTLISRTQIQRIFYLGFFIKGKQLASQVVFLIKILALGACRNLIFCVFVLFLAGFLFKSSIFSKSRLCTRPLISRFVTNLHRLTGQPSLWIPPWGQPCGRRLYGSTTLQSR